MPNVLFLDPCPSVPMIPGSGEVVEANHLIRYMYHACTCIIIQYIIVHVLSSWSNYAICMGTHFIHVCIHNKYPKVCTCRYKKTLLKLIYKTMLDPVLYCIANVGFCKYNASNDGSYFEFVASCCVASITEVCWAHVCRSQLIQFWVHVQFLCSYTKTRASTIARMSACWCFNRAF